MPLALPPRLAWTLAALAGLAAGAAVASRVARIEPGLELSLSTLAVTEDRQTFELRATPRGGVPITDVSLEVLAGEVLHYGRTRFDVVPPDNAANLVLRVRRDDPAQPRVRIRQGGPVPRTFEIDLPVDRRR